ncbi:MAG: hypothetical protein ACOC9W_01790 [Persicimonas sp.]
MKRMSLESRRPVFFVLLIMALTAFGLSSAGCGDGSLTSSIGQEADAGNNSAVDAEPDTSPDTGQPDVGEPDTGEPDTGEPDPCLDTTPQEAATFAGDYVTALCDKLMACGENPKVARAVTFGGWSSLEQCKQSVRAGTISAGRAEQAANQGSLTLNSCKSSDCLQSISNLDCMSAHLAIERARLDDISSCYDAWEGTRAADESCTVDAQCEGAQVCSRDQDADSCTGICVDAGQAGSGQCDDAVCDFDQYCQVDNQICVTRKGADESCEEDYQCSLDTRCDDGTCTAISTGLSAGQACNNDDQVCSLDLGCIGEECSAFLTEGQSCQFYGCEGDMYCHVETTECTKRLGAGEPCAADEQCQSRVCAGDTCTDVDSLCSDS